MRLVLTLATAVAMLLPLSLLAVDDESRINNEAEIRVTVEMEHEYATDMCMAAMELEYYQKGSSAHVETRLENPACAASSGSYTLEIRYRDAQGEVNSKEYSEDWERSDANTVVLVKDYFVAENVDIIRVRSRKLRCTCATTAAESDSN